MSVEGDDIVQNIARAVEMSVTKHSPGFFIHVSVFAVVVVITDHIRVETGPDTRLHGNHVLGVNTCLRSGTRGTENISIYSRTSTLRSPLQAMTSLGLVQAKIFKRLIV